MTVGAHQWAWPPGPAEWEWRLFDRAPRMLLLPSATGGCHIYAQERVLSSRHQTRELHVRCYCMLITNWALHHRDFYPGLWDCLLLHFLYLPRSLFNQYAYVVKVFIANSIDLEWTLVHILLSLGCSVAPISSSSLTLGCQSTYNLHTRWEWERRTTCKPTCVRLIFFYAHKVCAYVVWYLYALNCVTLQGRRMTSDDSGTFRKRSGCIERPEHTSLPLLATLSLMRPPVAQFGYSSCTVQVSRAADTPVMDCLTKSLLCCICSQPCSTLDSFLWCSSSGCLGNGCIVVPADYWQVSLWGEIPLGKAEIALQAKLN
jgi:hypothetical protein